MTPTLTSAQIDLMLRSFAHRHLEKPDACRNAGQIRFYVQELAQKIEEFERQFHYVPVWAYGLLAQYNAAYNRLVHKEFKQQYCSAA